MKATILLITGLLSIGMLKTTTYELNVKEGQKFEYTVELKQKITQQVMGQSSVTDMLNRFVSEIEVLSVSKSEYVFSQTYKSGVITMKNPAAFLDQNSNTEKGEGTDELDDLVGKKIIFKLDESYDVVSMEGVEEMVAVISGAGQAGSQVAQYMGESSVKRSIQGLLRGLKKDGFEKDMTWNESDSNESGTQTENEFRVINVSKKEMNYESTTSSSLDEEMNQNGMDMKVNLKGEFNGVGKVDGKTGLVVSYSNSGTLSGETSIEANDQLPMDLVIPMTIEQNSIFTLK